MKLYLTDAQKFVRSRLDEISQTDSDMMLSTVDDRNLNKTVEECIEEAIRYIHLNAPVQMLEPTYSLKNEDGETASEDKVYVYEIEDGVVTVSVREMDLLRLVYFKAGDSNITITRTVPEDSPEGRMQLNEYVRGRSDSPILVLLQGSDTYRPTYKYYSTTATDSFPFSCGVYEVPESKTDETGDYYEISTRLELAVLNQLTAMVLQSYGSQASQYYFQLATSYLS